MRTLQAVVFTTAGVLLTGSAAADPGDDRLTFVLRRNEEGHWLVFVEQTDY